MTTTAYCDCGTPAVGVSWRWDLIGTKTEIPLCADCRSAIREADRRVGYHARDDGGWRWRLYHEEE